MRRQITVALAATTVLAGCTAGGNLSASLGTMKNPQSPFTTPYGVTREANTGNPFFVAHYEVLKKGATKDALLTATPNDIKAYLQSGFALSDFYCDAFFKDADESQRRRSYGRAATNDVGTAIAAVLGLANAGAPAVAAAATAFGLADGLWRNYDEAFVVDADLANVYSLVLAAQENYSKAALADATLPTGYAEAQRRIRRYAQYCSTLGMRDLLNESARRHKSALEGNPPAPIAQTPAPTPGASPAPTPAATGATPVPTPTPSPTATPSPTPTPSSTTGSG